MVLVEQRPLPRDQRQCQREYNQQRVAIKLVDLRSRAFEFISLEVIRTRRLLVGFTVLAPRLKLVLTHLLARGTNDGSLVQPVVGHHSNVQLLAHVEAFVRVIRHYYVKATMLALVVVATGSPMLPFTKRLLEIH